MKEPVADFSARERAIRLWLIGVAALLFALILVGGATRLTESGLSIVEWRPITGTLPPLDQATWQAEFNKYKAIPQYQTMNRGMTIGEFKAIYWWEWTHRLLGRLVGVVFLVPLLWFWWRGWIEPDLRRRLLVIFALGGVQGAIGWWMVSSGLAERTEVSQYRLAVHLTLASLLYAAVVWTAQSLVPRGITRAPQRVRTAAAVLLGLVVVQIYFGALVAGLRAGRAYNTWPLIDGSLVPDSARLFFDQPFWRNFFENVLTVQFDHRMMAYALWLLAAWHLIDAARSSARGALSGAAVLAVVITAQAALGIATLLAAAPLGLALSHQAVAVMALTVAVVHAQRLHARKPQLAFLAGRTSGLTHPLS